MPRPVLQPRLRFEWWGLAPLAPGLTCSTPEPSSGFVRMWAARLSDLLKSRSKSPAEPSRLVTSWARGRVTLPPTLLGASLVAGVRVVFLDWMRHEQNAC